MRITARAPREYLVPAMGGFNAAADVGFFVGPAVGGVLAGVGLQWPFLMVLPVLGVALLVLVLPEPPEHPSARPAADNEAEAAANRP
jgi:MFS family permease